MGIDEKKSTSTTEIKKRVEAIQEEIDECIVKLKDVTLNVAKEEFRNLLGHTITEKKAHVTDNLNAQQKQLLKKDTKVLHQELGRIYDEAIAFLSKNPECKRSLTELGKGKSWSALKHERLKILELMITEPVELLLIYGYLEQEKNQIHFMKGSIYPTRDKRMKPDDRMKIFKTPYIKNYPTDLESAVDEIEQLEIDKIEAINQLKKLESEAKKKRSKDWWDSK